VCEEEIYTATARKSGWLEEEEWNGEGNKGVRSEASRRRRAVLDSEGWGPSGRTGDPVRERERERERDRNRDRKEEDKVVQEGDSHKDHGSSVDGGTVRWILTSGGVLRRSARLKRSKMPEATRSISTGGEAGCKSDHFSSTKRERRRGRGKKRQMLKSPAPLPREP
jgi:hypothetical protein